ncbi:HTH-type transcriptional regulator LutR [Calycomorphotria hydatis]|uniref:HTH-type transcriptional regulator LutR n=2 Tax=Calycomorphotria hydatis TaxID=2528027 RepID=A0A517TA49_9PLAN|nr:HTH-type transcriptional regulator LutR [Calycomorphotria hydatis]
MQICQRLLMGIFLHTYEAGQKLTVQPLAEQLNVSRTPVREALMELESLGLVDLLPNKGAVVRPFGPNEVREIFHVRRVLEREAAYCAAGTIPVSILEELRSKLKELIAAKKNTLYGSATRELDKKLHSIIAQHCGNQRLLKEISRYSTIYQALADAYYMLLESSERYLRPEENEEHLAIVEALLLGNSEKARDAMEFHLGQAVEAYIGDRFIGSDDSLENN